MTQDEIFEKLSQLPQYIYPDEIETIKEQKNIEAAVLYDANSYQPIYIYDNFIECILNEGMVFTIKENSLDEFIKKQEIKAIAIREKIDSIKSDNLLTGINSYNSEEDIQQVLSSISLVQWLSSISHISKGVISQGQATFPEDWTYLLNTNNSGVICVNDKEKVISVTHGKETAYFSLQNMIKLMQYENALSYTKHDVNNDNKEDYESRMRLKNLL